MIALGGGVDFYSNRNLPLGKSTFRIFIQFTRNGLPRFDHLSRRDANNRREGRDIFDDDRIRTDPDSFSDGHSPDHFRTCAEENIVPDDRGLTLLGPDCDLVFNFDARAAADVPINHDAQ